MSSIWSGCSVSRLLDTFGGSKVQGSIAVGVLHITVAGGGSHKGLNSLGMPIGSSVMQRCGPILSLHGTVASLQICLQQDNLTQCSTLELYRTLTYQDTAGLCATQSKIQGLNNFYVTRLS